MPLPSFLNLFRPTPDKYAAARAAEAAGRNGEAIKLYQQAARAGSGPAHYRLGEIYRDGLLGQPVDWERASDAFTAASIAREAEPAGQRAQKELIDAGLSSRILCRKPPPYVSKDRLHYMNAFGLKIPTSPVIFGKVTPAPESEAERKRRLLDRNWPEYEEETIPTVTAAKELLMDWEVRGWLEPVAAPKAGSNLAAQRVQLAAAAENDGVAAWTLARRLLSGRWGPADDLFIDLQMNWALISETSPPPALALAYKLMPESSAGWWEKLQKQAAAGAGEAALWLGRLEHI